MLFKHTSHITILVQSPNFGSLSDTHDLGAKDLLHDESTRAVPKHMASAHWDSSHSHSNLHTHVQSDHVGLFAMLNQPSMTKTLISKIYIL